MGRQLAHCVDGMEKSSRNIEEGKGEKMYYQQGDIIIESVEEVPQDAKQVLPEGGQFVLAEGEATGHAHAIEVQEEVKVLTLADALFIKAGVPVTVVHEEHDPITVAPGVYRVGAVREYDHFAEESRRVMD